MLVIKDLRATVEGKEILAGINLEVNAGEVHAIMGPNGSGKSTLSAVLAGRDLFEVTQGSVTFNGKEPSGYGARGRAREGLFLGFQYPVEIPGVSMVNFMRTAVNEHRKYRGQPEMVHPYFLKLMRDRKALVEIDTALTNGRLMKAFRVAKRNVTKYSKWPCSILPWPFSMKPTLVSISMH
jgi:Fe-S cluster assembly ATP-binding protein